MDNSNTQKSTRNRRFGGQEGFTLMELMVVLAIIGVLTAVAVPVFSNILERSREQADEATRAVVETAVEVYRASEGHLPEISGESPEENFKALVDLLQEKSYLKKGELKPQGKRQFTYDASQGVVGLK